MREAYREIAMRLHARLPFAVATRTVDERTCTHGRRNDDRNVGDLFKEPRE